MKTLSRQEILNIVTRNVDGKEPYGRIQQFLQKAVDGFISDKDPKKTVIVDLGSYNRRVCAGAVNVDIVKEDTDIVADITDFVPMEDNSVDFIICTAVLEHVKDPQKVVAEMHRILRTGGEAWVDIPFMQPYHKAPDDFQRFTISGIKHLFRNFEVMGCGNMSPNGFSTFWIFNEWIQTTKTNGDWDHEKYPKLTAFEDSGYLKEIEEEVKRMDQELMKKYWDSGFPDNMHKVANALYVYVRK